MDTEKQEREAIEAQACTQQPAVMVNKFYIAAAPNHLRIAFMEVLHPHGQVRCAVVMDRADAKSLVDTINLLLLEGTKQ